MKAEREDRSANHHKKQRNPWLVVGIITAVNVAVLFTLAKTGWGITIDLNKLSEAIYVNDSKKTQDVSHRSAEPLPEQLAIAPPAKPAEIPTGPRQAPIYYSVSLNKFNSVFIQHPACSPHDMKWTQMECSNFRARAMKRFQIEWNKNSYWDGYRVINNRSADRTVNSELTD